MKALWTALAPVVILISQSSFAGNAGKYCAPAVQMDQDARAVLDLLANTSTDPEKFMASCTKLADLLKPKPYKALKYWMPGTRAIEWYIQADQAFKTANWPNIKLFSDSSYKDQYSARIDYMLRQAESVQTDYFELCFPTSESNPQIRAMDIKAMRVNVAEFMINARFALKDWKDCKKEYAALPPQPDFSELGIDEVGNTLKPKPKAAEIVKSVGEFSKVPSGLEPGMLPIEKEELRVQPNVFLNSSIAR
ncbi:MAG: hypothetical protein ACXWPM_13120 [Bdellovibrionota bacterium]